MKSKGLTSTSYVLFENNEFTKIEAQIVRENQICIYLNGQELTTLMCTPDHLEDLAIGFLRSEEIITSLNEISVISLSANENCVDVWLNDQERNKPTRRIITTGCGGGVTFDDLLKERPPLPFTTTIEAEAIGKIILQTFKSASLYHEARGVHTATLNNGCQLELVTEDIGRHNTIDRLWGQALRQNITTEGKIVASTGRISSEMLGKTVKMGVPILISSTSPTSLSIDLANLWNITIIGYAHRNSFRIYSAPSRVIGFSDYYKEK